MQKVSAKLKLKEPIHYGSEVITELEIRKPKAKDMRVLPQNPSTGDIIDLAGRLCAQPASVMDELGIEDLTQLMEIVGGFLGHGQKTGQS